MLTFKILCQSPMLALFLFYMQTRSTSSFRPKRFSMWVSIEEHDYEGNEGLNVHHPHCGASDSFQRWRLLFTERPLRTPIKIQTWGQWGMREQTDVVLLSCVCTTDPEKTVLWLNVDVMLYSHALLGFLLKWPFQSVSLNRLSVWMVSESLRCGLVRGGRLFSRLEIN